MEHIVVIGGALFQVGRALLFLKLVFERQLVEILNGGLSVGRSKQSLGLVLGFVLVEIEREGRRRIGAAAAVAEGGYARGKGLGNGSREELRVRGLLVGFSIEAAVLTSPAG